ncbi:MAG: tetratricopeptide repeat protein [Acidobacteria bacterium]|nr:tetratricopeptide repeat protein [Acidobacteriota bacterium]MCH8016775.1 tetratricopeptide repeat protein [Acidobacteriota bacterium]
MNPKRKLPSKLADVVLPIIIALVLYFGTLNAPFLYDDFSYVVDNTQIREVSNAPRLWITPYHQSGLYRPVTATSYLIDYFFFSLDPRGFHLSNLLLYLMTILLFSVVIREVGGNRSEALLASLVFAAHPVHTEAVSWIVGRAEVLAGLFCFLGLIGWARFRKTDQWRYLILTCVAYFLALGAKEIAAPLPAVLFLGEALGLFGSSNSHVSNSSLSSWTGRLRPLLRYFLILAAVFALYLSLRIAVLGQFGIDQRSIGFAGDSAQTRWASTLFGIGHYIRLCLFPTQLRIDYMGMKLGNLFDWRVILSFGVLCVLGFMIFRFGRRVPRITFWLGWFALFLLPISNLVVQIGVFLAERFLFLPSAAACAIFGAGFVYGLSDQRQRWIRGLTGLGLIVLLCTFSFMTIVRNRDWQDPERFWRTALAQPPVSQKTHHSLGALLWDLGRERNDLSLLDESDRILEAGFALRFRPDWKLTNDHVLIVQDLANHYRERGHFEEAIQLYEQIIPLTQRDPALFPLGRSAVLGNYGLALEKADRLEEALSAYEQIVATGEQEHLAGAMMMAGTILHRMGDFEGAIQRFQEAIQVNPTFGEAYFNLAPSLFEVKRSKEAFESLVQARQLGVSRAGEYARERAQQIINQAVVAENYGLAQQAMESLLAVVEETAQDAYSQGLWTEQLGNPDMARNHYQRALTLDPQHSEALSALERTR